MRSVLSAGTEEVLKVSAYTSALKDMKTAYVQSND